MSKRDEFPKKVKLALWERSKGRCECGCGVRFVGTPVYDHYPIAAALGGTGTYDNGRVLDPSCNRRITYGHDIPAIAKSTRTLEKRIGARPSSRPMPFGRNSPWKRRMDGSVVRR